jgi:hypothetical protein
VVRVSGTGILAVVYGVVAFLFVRPIAGALAYRMRRVQQTRYPTLYGDEPPEPTGGQWLGAICVALLIVCVWPLAVVFVVQGRCNVWTVGPERLARIEARERRVHQLERELGVSP